MRNFTLKTGDDGIAIVTFDMPGRSMNTISHEVQSEIGQLAEIIHNDDCIIGAVLRSGKASGFCAGADLGELGADMERWQVASSQSELKTALHEAGDYSLQLRALETVGKPLVAIVEGAVLGGGLELALACHYRIAVASERLRMGLPEATLGLMPGAGGTQRLSRIVGLNASLSYLLDGTPISLEEALALRVIHKQAEAEEALNLARCYIVDSTTATAPWDEKAFAMPGGGPHSRSGYAQFGPAIAARRGSDRPAGAEGNILKALYEGAQVPLDAALRIETRYFLNTLRAPGAGQGIAKFLERSR